MGDCGCAKRNPRPRWEPRAAKTPPAPAPPPAASHRIVSDEERAAERAAGRPPRARQPTSA